MAINGRCWAACDTRQGLAKRHTPFDLRLAVVLVAALSFADHSAKASDYELLDDTALQSLGNEIGEGLSATSIRAQLCPIHVLLERKGVELLGQDGLERWTAVVLQGLLESELAPSCEPVIHDASAEDTSQTEPQELMKTYAATGSGSLLRIVNLPVGDRMMSIVRFYDADGGYLASSVPIYPAVAAGGEDGAVAAGSSEEEITTPIEEEIATPVVEAPNMASSDQVLTLAGNQAFIIDLLNSLAQGYLDARSSGAFAPEGESSQGRQVWVSKDFPLKIEVINTSAEAPLDLLLQGESDVAASRRAIDEDAYTTFLQQQSVDMRSRRAEYVIGFDGIQVLVNRANLLPRLQRATLVDILRGDLTEWSDGVLARSNLDGPIRVIGPDRDHGIAEAMGLRVLEDRPTAAVERLGSSDDIVNAVRSDAYSLGYADPDETGGTRSLAFDECGVVYHSSDPFALKTEDNPLGLRLYLYLNPLVDHEQRDDFLSFVMSPRPGEGQSIVGSHHANLDVVFANDDQSQERWQIVAAQTPVSEEAWQRFQEEIATARRVSTTFRFRFDSDELDLDSRGEHDLEKLVRTLDDANIASDQIRLFGFADALGGTKYNRKLSWRRAKSVAERLWSYGLKINNDQIFGIGEDAPVACNDDEAGQERNRRVEVWVQDAAQQQADARRAIEQ